MPKLDPENNLAVYLFKRILPGLGNGMGGYNFQAIDSVLKNYHIRPAARPALYDKILVIIEILNEIRKAKNNS